MLSLPMSLLLSLTMILVGAKGFTNGVEWLGRKLNLRQGAVGSILAAVGTALPETLVPLVAILTRANSSQGSDIGIGAILGAPFMLSTLGFFVTGLAVWMHRGRRSDFPQLRVETQVIARDLGFFLVCYSLALAASFSPGSLAKKGAALILVVIYFVYAYLCLTRGQTLGEAGICPPCLYFNPERAEPRTSLIIFQVLFFLDLLLVGARLFVLGLSRLAEMLGVPPFILALIIAPIATELPEKCNSAIWVYQRKDTLALGNMTGAMVFQGSLIPALGMALTDWRLSPAGLFSALLALLMASLVLGQIRKKGYLTVYPLLAGGIFYLLFILTTLRAI